jgi:hypothetical protein
MQAVAIPLIFMPEKKGHAVATSSLVHTGCNRLVYIFLSNFDTLQSCTFLTGLFM